MSAETVVKYRVACPDGKYRGAGAGNRLIVDDALRSVRRHGCMANCPGGEHRIETCTVTTSEWEPIPEPQETLL